MKQDDTVRPSVRHITEIYDVHGKLAMRIGRSGTSVVIEATQKLIVLSAAQRAAVIHELMDPKPETRTVDLFEYLELQTNKPELPQT